MSYSAGGGRTEPALRVSDGGATRPPDRTALLADDDDRLRETFKLWLRDAWTVVEAATGTDALSKLTERVDVLVLDRRMPELSGPEVLDRLDDTPFDGPVVVVSAYEPDDHLPETAVAAYLTKPVDREEFRGVLDDLVS